MLSRKWLKSLGLCAIPLAALCFAPAAAQAQHQCHHCQRFHCPPGVKHCLEGAPHIHFQRGCPRPICNPCLNPNWGYFEPCWNAWPWPPDFSHCRTLPPAAHVVLNPHPVGFGAPHGPPPRTTPEPATLPPPRTLR
jgi:hypothetical protein